MWEFIILGQVPGTSIQVSFESWLIGTPALLFSIIVLWLIRKHRTSLLMFGIAFTLSAQQTFNRLRLKHWLHLRPAAN